MERPFPERLRAFSSSTFFAQAEILGCRFHVFVDVQRFPLPNLDPEGLSFDPTPNKDGLPEPASATK